MCVTRKVGRKMSLASKEHAIIIDLQSDDTKLAWHATVTFSSNVDKGAKAEGPHMLLLNSREAVSIRFFSWYNSLLWLCKWQILRSAPCNNAQELLSWPWHLDAFQSWTSWEAWAAWAMPYQWEHTTTCCIILIHFVGKCLEFRHV